MGISFLEASIGIVCAGLGYYFKARFEINQEEEIKNLKQSIQKMKEEHKEELRVLNYKHYQLERSKDFLERNFLEFQEKVKIDRLDKIISEKNAADSMSKRLKQFL
jgi:hypothetical protein